MNDKGISDIIELFRFIKNDLIEVPQSVKIKNDYDTFKSFVSQFPAWLELAQKYNKRPDELLKLFSGIGQEVLNRSNDILVSKFSKQLKENFSAKNIKLSDNSIAALDELITFIKKNNEVK